MLALDDALDEALASVMARRGGSPDEALRPLAAAAPSGASSPSTP
jgi:hypothetical protein